jgi:hypothetical protein
MVRALGKLHTNIAAIGLAAVVAWAGVVSPAQAVDFSGGADPNLTKPTANGGSCPTLSNVRPIEVWYNLQDMNARGYSDPGNHEAWPFMVKTAQVICGAAQNAEIRIGMYFIRALGTMTSAGEGSRPESDPEVIYNALEWVHKNRNVKITIVLEKRAMPQATRDLVSKRLSGIASVYTCSHGCFNTRSKATKVSATKTIDYINHEKIVAISHTVWGNSDGNAGSDDSVVLSSSGNWARSQTRLFYQETVLVYGDKRYQTLLADRFDAMLYCAKTGCKKNTGFPTDQKAWLKSKRKIWVDPIQSGHLTSNGRGTSVAFAPAPTSTRDYYLQAFDKVDCAVQNKIRIAMFRLTDDASKKFAGRLAQMKKQGCDIKIVLTSPVGDYSVTSFVKKKLKKAGIWFKCSPVSLHTKLVLIGSKTGLDAKVITSTAAMGVLSLTQSDEHTTIFDSSRATLPGYAEAIRHAYGEYLSGWTEIAKESKGC